MSTRHAEIHAFDALVQRMFLTAKKGTVGKKPGWTIHQTVDEKARQASKGATNLALALISIVESKNGLTVTLVNPLVPNFLDANEVDLTAAGFKVTADSLEWNRKTPLPMAPIEHLLQRFAITIRR